MALKNIALSCLTTLLMLALVEIGLQLADYPKTPEIGWGWAQSPYRGPLNAQDTQINQLGLRGRTIAYSPDDLVVVLLGDSQVEAGMLPAQHMPERLLENALQRQLNTAHVKVFSVASAGWGQDQQLLALQQYFKQFRADVVLLWTTPVNDYWENTFIDRSITVAAGKLKPSFYLDHEQLETLLPTQFDWKLPSLLVLALEHGLGNKQFTLEQYYVNRWQQRLPRADNQPVTPSACPSLEILEKRLIESYLAGQRNYTVVTDEAVSQGRSHFMPFLTPLSARDQYAIKLTHHLFGAIATLSAQHQATFHIVHPYRSDLDGAFREIRCVKTNQAQYFKFDGSDWLRYVKQSSLHQQLLTFEATSPYPMNILPGDWHLSLEGNQQVMKQLAASLVNTLQ